METFGRQLCALLALCCAAAATPAAGDMLDRQELLMHADIAAEPCRFTDPSDPHQIVGPNPSHGHCLAALHPAAMLLEGSRGNSASGSAPSAVNDGAEATGESSVTTSFGRVWLVALAAVAMLVLAGFNSRKRRQLPEPGLADRYVGHPRLPTHSESPLRNED